MSLMLSGRFRRRVDAALAQAEALGHHLRWQTVGSQIVRAVCERCGRTLVVHGRNNLYGADGPVLHEACESSVTPEQA